MWGKRPPHSSNTRRMCSAARPLIWRNSPQRPRTEYGFSDQEATCAHILLAQKSIVPSNALCGRQNPPERAAVRHDRIKARKGTPPKGGRYRDVAGPKAGTTDYGIASRESRTANRGWRGVKPRPTGPPYAHPDVVPQFTHL